MLCGAVSPSELTIRLELGRDHDEYGACTSGAVSDRTAFAISVGADEASPSRQYKGDVSAPNEDGLLVIESSDRVMMAVADAHYGTQSSHETLTALAEDLRQIPGSVEELGASIAALGQQRVRGYRSETTLLVAVLDRKTRSGFGVSYGDSSIALVGPGGFRSPGPAPNTKFVSFADPRSFAAENSRAFDFTAQAEDLLLVFTDGIDECHYRRAETSVGPDHMQALYAASDGQARAYVRALVELALSGVDGNPGGQDNIALVATPA